MHIGRLHGRQPACLLVFCTSQHELLVEIVSVAWPTTQQRRSPVDAVSMRILKASIVGNLSYSGIYMRSRDCCVNVMMCARLCAHHTSNNLKSTSTHDMLILALISTTCNIQENRTRTASHTMEGPVTRPVSSRALQPSASLTEDLTM